VRCFPYKPFKAILLKNFLFLTTGKTNTDILLPVLDETYKTESNKIKGCQSQVWLNSYLFDNKVFFEADSDATIVKGLAGLLIRVFSGQTPDDIINTELTFLNEIGMSQHLSPTRSNGLAAMVKQIKMRALVYKAKNAQTLK
jgi:cysteine desulfuration protein SufE